MKTTICFIRHGQTEINQLRKIQGRKDYPLNDVGRRQAHMTGAYLKMEDPSWDIIYSSPLSRAYETATIIKTELNLTVPIVKDEHFIEREFGDAEGCPVCKEVFQKIQENKILNMETNQEIQKRVLQGVFGVSHKEHRKILIVAHSHTIKALLTYLDSTRTFQDFIDNCSMNYFTIEDKHIHIEQTNITPNKKG